MEETSKHGVLGRYQTCSKERIEVLSDTIESHHPLQYTPSLLPSGSSTRTIPIGTRIWTDVEPGEYSLSDYASSKKLIHLLRHADQLHREDVGAIEFWRI